MGISYENKDFHFSCILHGMEHRVTRRFKIFMIWWLVCNQYFSMHLCMCANSLQLCPTLCNTMDCSLPGSSLHGSLQARILEWVNMPSRRSSQPKDLTCDLGIKPESLTLSVLSGGFFTTNATWEASFTAPFKDFRSSIPAGLLSHSLAWPEVPTS